MIVAYCQEIFDKAIFLKTIGAELIAASEGNCVIRLKINESHYQQDGFVHAGVQSTLADHSCGTAVGSLLEAGQLPLSIEFKINFLRPCVGDFIEARSRVIKHGRKIAIAECDVFAITSDREVMTAKMMATLAVVEG
ncbi:MAG TPA: PaaI family thioesterase [Chitinophagales bacterium]|nr:PaaI family thioesterase [Chitinophagales bacterium]